MRGVLVGISGVFYAAKAAGCAEELLTRDQFVQSLEDTLKDKLVNLPEASKLAAWRKDVANLTLVITVITHGLHSSSHIVCKRNWMLHSANDRTAAVKDEFTATWGLGCFLEQANLTN